MVSAIIDNDQFCQAEIDLAGSVVVRVRMKLGG
jgi:hypothetical protein